MSDKTILIVGTYDTKNDELEYMASRIKAMGGGVLTMDVSVLGDPEQPKDISKHQVAEAAGSSIQAAIDFNSENKAIQMMAAGASRLAADLLRQGRFDGIVFLGGTMATDLALDVCQALPLGIPKYVVSTVSFSPLIEPGRLAADIQMILWAGGLYGLNSVCKSSLSQAAGAVLGAARAVEPCTNDRPVVGMTSLGSSCLRYMKRLKPALEARGFEVAIFHSTGMGGMAYESIAAKGEFACVMDFSMQELSNLVFGSVVNSGQDRLLSAGRAGTPQLVAPGAIDLIDFAGWQAIPKQFQDRPFHAHNRLIKSSALNSEERRQTAREMAKRLSESGAPTHLILPNQGIEEWDKEGGDAYDPQGLAAFCDEMRKAIVAPVKMTEIDAHINDQAFADTALEIFDQWVADGTIKTS
ncbi:Tm-1-like ATP-binding domain-containing protein [Leucothrix mucor]|uniref:Tm-1-like ATP-binding domain-containing protein n=1 Tax=Leucothrix mucor TaxID=45248 RepID=UPI0003B41653|nr:Tm-1-like ATP-binding domain-containing protein [Leucothrix mucor]